MKAELESKEIQYRGVKLTAETDEEVAILQQIMWGQLNPPMGPGRPVSIDNIHRQIIIAPTPAKEGTNV